MGSQERYKDTLMSKSKNRPKKEPKKPKKEKPKMPFPNKKC